MITVLRSTKIILTAAVIAVSLQLAAADSSYFNQKGMDELRSSRPESAARFFLRAIAIDSGRKHYYNNLAAAYMRMGEYTKAEEQLKKSLGIDEKYARALSNMSVTLFHLGRYRESYRYYTLSMDSDREYTGQRFDRKRVSANIKKLSDEKPEDKELKRLREFILSDNGDSAGE